MIYRERFKTTTAQIPFRANECFDFGINPFHIARKKQKNTLRFYHLDDYTYNYKRTLNYCQYAEELNVFFGKFL